MVNIDQIRRLADSYCMPLEDVLFVALNYHGVEMDVPYNRMRMAFHLSGSDPLFSYASGLGDLDYYFALPINHRSPFRISGERLRLQNYEIGSTIGATEDFCDSHYPRRRGTSLNINPNSRTSCRGCEFCYTAYQVPCDRKRMRTAGDIREFMAEWTKAHNARDLSHLIQVSVVTGCYDSEEHLTDFLLALSGVLQELSFRGRVFYLGSVLTSSEAINTLSRIPSFGYCVSLECFTRRDLLKDAKRVLTIPHAKRIMHECLDSGMEVNYTYVVGLEPVATFVPYMQDFLHVTNKFPTINILQLHQQHGRHLLHPTAERLTYFMEARSAIERIFQPTALRPLVWEDYRSLWYLRFGAEVLTGWRVPE